MLYPASERTYTCLCVTRVRGYHKVEIVDIPWFGAGSGLYSSTLLSLFITSRFFSMPYGKTCHKGIFFFFYFFLVLIQYGPRETSTCEDSTSLRHRLDESSLIVVFGQFQPVKETTFHRRCQPLSTFVITQGTKDASDRGRHCLHTKLIRWREHRCYPFPHVGRQLAPYREGKHSH